METDRQKKRRLFGKQNYLNQYLNELNRLVKIVNLQSHLISLNETDNIHFLNNTKWIKLTLPFSIKGEYLSAILPWFAQTAEDGFYIITDFSKDCGALFLENLHNFNFDFGFDDEHSGLIIIIDKDYSKKLLLDFYESDNGYLMMEIEIYGDICESILNQALLLMQKRIDVQIETSFANSVNIQDTDCRKVIIKPNTPSGEKLMQDNGHKTEKIFYDPKDPKYQPGSPTYIGPKK